MWNAKANPAQQGTLSADQIRQLYVSMAETSTREHRHDSVLSISAQYVVKQAKKKLQGAISSLDEDELQSQIQLVEQEENEFLSDRERNAVIASLRQSLDHYDILTPLVQNPAVNDIIVSRHDNISVQIGRRNIQTDLRFPNKEAYKAFIEQLLKRAGKSCTTASPVVDAAIDPHIRVCVQHESFSPQDEGPFLTIRIARKDKMSAEALLASEMLPEEILSYLQNIVRSGVATVLVAGEVGTGKTTLVRVLANSIEADEALLVIEDTHELMVRRPFTRTLITREANSEGVGRIAPSEAIRAGMRMAMNRVILGEMRDAQAAEAFIDVCASGHPGISTIHARSVRDALNRLELFLLRAQPGVGVDVVRRLIANAVSVVVHVGLDSTARRRRVLRVDEIVGASDGQIQTSPIFAFENDASPLWKRSSGVTAYSQELKKYGVMIPPVGTSLVVENLKDDSQ